MPLVNTPIQPQYDDAVTEEELAAAQGQQLPPNQLPAAYMQQNFVPNGADIKGTALQEQYLKQQQEALNRQQLGVDQFQHNVQNLQNKETQVDLSPLAALADSWGIAPSNFAATYKRPMSQDEKNAQVMALQEKLQAQKDKISDNRTQALSSAIAAYKANKDDSLNNELKRSTINKNNAMGQMMMTPGQKSADVTYAKDYTDWRALGGYAGVQKNVNALEKAIQDLEKNPDLSGGATGNLPPALRLQLNERGYTLQQDVESAGMAGLRQTMGSQFTDEEGKRFLNRLYDPRLSGHANAQKIRAAIQELKDRSSARDTSADYFEKTGSLRGLDTSNMRLKPSAAPPARGAPVSDMPAAPAWTPEKEARMQELAKKKQGGQ